MTRWIPVFTGMTAPRNDVFITVLFWNSHHIQRVQAHIFLIFCVRWFQEIQNYKYCMERYLVSYKYACFYHSSLLHRFLYPVKTTRYHLAIPKVSMHEAYDHPLYQSRPLSDST